LEESLAVILSIPGQPLHYYSRSITADEVETAIVNLRRSFLPFTPTKEQQGLTQPLYNWLLRPAEPLLAEAEIETLAFVLDGAFRSVPMAALHDGQGYLIERYKVALAPSLELLTSAQLGTTDLNLFAGGVSEARQGFAALPQVQAELAGIAQAIPRTQALIDDDFTEERLQGAIAQPPLNAVHLATHGQFGSTAEETYILTWDDRITVTELERMLQTRQVGSDLPIDLLVLSACQTARGDQQATLGMAGMAVRSGARSTVASLWPLDDGAAKVFMTTFYEVLSQTGTSKGDALRAAQLELLARPEFSAPYFWASLLLIGNWQ
ncbi:MAG: CHAT domain-containing protein, partial [Cyanobacteria bacterium P01_H01_bin.15]